MGSGPKFADLMKPFTFFLLALVAMAAAKSLKMAEANYLEAERAADEGGDEQQQQQQKLDEATTLGLAFGSKAKVYESTCTGCCGVMEKFAEQHDGLFTKVMKDAAKKHKKCFDRYGQGMLMAMGLSWLNSDAIQLCNVEEYEYQDKESGAKLGTWKTAAAAMKGAGGGSDAKKEEKPKELGEGAGAATVSGDEECKQQMRKAVFGVESIEECYDFWDIVEPEEEGHNSCMMMAKINLGMQWAKELAKKKLMMKVNWKDSDGDTFDRYTWSGPDNEESEL